MLPSLPKIKSIKISKILIIKIKNNKILSKFISIGKISLHNQHKKFIKIFKIN